MRVSLEIITTICIGLLIGTEFAVSAFINPILRKLGAREELRAIRLFAAKLGHTMPFWYAGSLLLLIAEIVIRYKQAGESLLIAASVTTDGYFINEPSLLYRNHPHQMTARVDHVDGLDSGRRHLIAARADALRSLLRD